MEFGEKLFQTKLQASPFSFLPVPLRELVRPSLACEQTFLLPQKKIDFFLRERGRLYTGWVVPHFFFRLASNAFPDVGSVGRIAKKNLK